MDNSLFELFNLKHRIIIDVEQLNKSHKELTTKAPNHYKSTIEAAYKILIDPKLRKEYREKGRKMELTDLFSWEDIDTLQAEFLTPNQPTSHEVPSENAATEPNQITHEKYGEIIYHRVRQRSGKTELKFQVNIIGLELLDLVWVHLDEIIRYGQTGLVNYLKMLRKDHPRQYKNLILQFNQLNPYLKWINEELNHKQM